MEKLFSRCRRRLQQELVRCFPRTTAYLRGDAPSRAGEATASVPQKAPAAAKPAAREQKPPVETGIYASRQWPANAAAEQAMREKVAEAVAAGLLGAPSDEQWAMILAREPLLRVFAGAGSGKSSTLLLRVLFLVCHRGVEAERLTVVSFTNASCAELRERLLVLLKFWGVSWDAGQARRCVRTFHSLLVGLARATLGDPGWFDQLGQRGEADNPMAGGHLSAAQRRVLDEVLETPEFAERCAALAPSGSLQLSGELRAQPLAEALYAQGVFALALGLEPSQLAQVDGVPAKEQDFLQLLAAFWPAFEQRLQADGLMAFDRAFTALRERLEAGEVPEALLSPLQYLLIDEFQDVSPQIVAWLAALHRALDKLGQPPSLMAIGDDWQSIYAWRGSSPQLFADFDRHFPRQGRARSKVLLLERNYRCVEPVLRDAARLIEGVRYKRDKTCQAVLPTRKGDHGVKVIEDFDLARDLPRLQEEIARQCQRLAEGERLLLLSRRNDSLRKVVAVLDKALPVRAMTIHRAKGLQATVAIILDDCPPPLTHPLRDALYRQAGCFKGGYAEAMADESLRLAYVAVTRGARRVLWFTRKRQGATALLAGA